MTLPTTALLSLIPLADGQWQAIRYSVLSSEAIIVLTPIGSACGLGLLVFTFSLTGHVRRRERNLLLFLLGMMQFVNTLLWTGWGFSVAANMG